MDITLPMKVQGVIDAFTKNGFKCFAVGGSVRDLLMGKPTNRWDFATNATPEQIQKLFPDISFYENTFGTVGIKIAHENGEDVFIQAEEIYEITTFRTEGNYSDKRHPDAVAWGKTIEQDLARRDFTINAVAFDGKTLVDPYKGQGDVKNKLIKAVGDPGKRFNEDALRLMRAIRIATQLGFTIDAQTSQAIKKHASLLTTISFERIRDELMKILASNHPANGILLLKNHGLLWLIFPELTTAFETEQKSPKRHHIYDVGTHLIESLRNCPSPNPIVRLATFLHDIGKPATYKKGEDGVITFYNHEIVSTNLVHEIAKRLRFSRSDTGKLIRLVRWHQFSVDERQTDKAIRRFIRNVGQEYLADMLALRTGDRLGGGATETSWRFELFKKRLLEVQQIPFTVADLAINGHDVMQTLHIKPGPKVGEILNTLFAEVEDKKIENNKEAILSKLKDLQKKD